MRIWVAATIAALTLPATAAAGTVFLLDGRGWGHGVGMSQWGAEGYARHGWTYRKILAHYYPRTRIGIAPARDVRVLLFRGRDSVRVGSAAPFVVVDARGKTLRFPARAVVVDRRFMLRAKKLRQPLRFRAGAQPLQVELAGYRGDVVVKAKPDGLMAVNVLPLDRYLRGVVPWEAPRGWRTQTYEAQAVAARSYTLATLRPGQDFDLYPDQRSQMYGGIRAERAQTNLAVGATAGQVLVWRDRIVPAYYFSASGGRTSSVSDAWPKAKQVPYLVSVADPYDYLSPRHVWPTQVLTPGQIGATLDVSGVRDVRVVRNSSGRARAMRVLTSRGWRTFPAQTIRKKFRLGSTNFDVRAMSLEQPAPAVYGATAELRGFVRGLGGARLQRLTQAGWRTVRRLRVRADGRFSVWVPAATSTEFRLAYNGIPGDAVALSVAPRVSVIALGARLRAFVRPSLPLRVERLTAARWRPVARGVGGFDRTLRPGSYRVEVLGGAGFLPRISRPVALRARVAGP